MASTLIGTVLGGLLAILGGYLVGLKQRAWQKEQAMFERDLAKEQAQFERELSITKALDQSLVEAERRILGRGMRGIASRRIGIVGLLQRDPSAFPARRQLGPAQPRRPHG